MFEAIFELKEKENLTEFSYGQGTKSVGYKTGDELQRVEKLLLEQEYAVNPLVFNMVNKYVQGVLSKKPIFKSTVESDKPILDIIGNTLGLNTRLMPHIVKDMCIFGTSWDEKIKDEDENLVALDSRDPKYMDIGKGGYPGNSWPLITSSGKPEFYVQFLRSFQEPKDPSRSIFQLGRPAIRFEVNEIFRVNMYGLGDSLDGIGIVEPLYNISRSKTLVEESTTQSILRLGKPIVISKVGSDKVYPSKQLIDKVSESTMTLNERSGITLPYYVDISVLEPKRPENLTDNLDYYSKQLIAGSGLPESVVTGGGGGTNKHTLEQLMMFLEGTFDMMRNNIKEAFDTEVCPDIKRSKIYSLKGDITLEWIEQKRTNVFSREIDDDNPDDVKEVTDEVPKL